MEIKLATSKINSTLLKTKNKKTINYNGQWFISPGRDFHSSNTPETLQKKEKMVNNWKFKKILFNKKTKNNQPPWAMVHQPRKKLSLFQHTGDSLEKGKNGRQLEI